MHKSCSRSNVDFFFFFFLEITAYVLMSCLTEAEVCTPLIIPFCLTEAKSGIFDEKSGTRPEKAGRMVTLFLAICDPNYLRLRISL